MSLSADIDVLKLPKPFRCKKWKNKVFIRRYYDILHLIRILFHYNSLKSSSNGLKVLLTKNPVMHMRMITRMMYMPYSLNSK